MEAEWSVGQNKSEKASYTSEVRVFAPDRSGLTVDVLKVLIDENVPVNNVNARSLKNGDAVVDISMKIAGREQLEIVCKKIMQVNGVYQIERVNL